MKQEDLKTAENIYLAGKDWKQFDFVKGLGALIEKDKDGEYIYLTGMYWKQFDFVKGLDALKKFPEYYEKAKEDWPMGVKEFRKRTQEELDKAKEIDSKVIKLKKGLKEEFVDADLLHFGKSNETITANIYKNPTRKEILETLSGQREVRFILVHKTQDLFIFPIFLLHSRVAKKLNIPYENSESIAGVASYNSRENMFIALESISMNSMDRKEKEKMKKKDWSWALEKRKIFLGRLVKAV